MFRYVIERLTSLDSLAARKISYRISKVYWCFGRELFGYNWLTQRCDRWIVEVWIEVPNWTCQQNKKRVAEYRSTNLECITILTQQFSINLTPLRDSLFSRWVLYGASRASICNRKHGKSKRYMWHFAQDYKQHSSITLRSQIPQLAKECQSHSRKSFAICSGC